MPEVLKYLIIPNSFKNFEIFVLNIKFMIPICKIGISIGILLYNIKTSNTVIVLLKV